MDSQLEHWQEQALATDAKERQVRRGLEKMVSIELPIGVGALSWITVELEIRGWDRFQNRPQISSYTGLCPGIHNSNGRGREGRINRCGLCGLPACHLSTPSIPNRAASPKRPPCRRAARILGRPNRRSRRGRWRRARTDS
jgi:transposase